MTHRDTTPEIDPGSFLLGHTLARIEKQIAALSEDASEGLEEIKALLEALPGETNATLATLTGTLATARKKLEAALAAQPPTP